MSGEAEITLVQQRYSGQFPEKPAGKSKLVEPKPCGLSFCVSRMLRGHMPAGNNSHLIVRGKPLQKAEWAFMRIPFNWLFALGRSDYLAHRTSGH